MFLASFSTLSCCWTWKANATFLSFVMYHFKSLACTKTRNNETKPPKRAKRNYRNERNETTETSETKPPKRAKRNHRNERNKTTETSETTKTKNRYDKYDTKRPKQHHRPAKDNYLTCLGLWAVTLSCKDWNKTLFLFVCILSQSVLLLFSLKLRLNCIVRDEGVSGF